MIDLDNIQMWDFIFTYDYSVVQAAVGDGNVNFPPKKKHNLIISKAPWFT